MIRLENSNDWFEVLVLCLLFIENKSTGRNHGNTYNLHCTHI
jgi:hypothetical protein